MKLKSLYNDKNIREIFSKSAIFLFFKIGGFCFGYLFTILITRNYGKESYGLISLAFTFFIILAVVSKFGFDINITRIISSTKHTKTSVRSLYIRIVLSSLALALLLAVVIYYSSETISNKLFNNEDLKEYLAWAAYSFPLWSVILINAGVFRGFKKNTLFSFFGSFGRFFLASFLLFLVFISEIENSSLTPMVVHFIVVVILAVISTIICLLLLRSKENDSSVKIHTKNFVLDSLPIFMSSVIFILLGWIDRIILGVFDTEDNVALLDVSVKIALLIGFGLEAFNSILAPKVSEHYYSNDKSGLKNSINFTAFMNSIIAVFMFLLIVFFAEEVLTFFGDEFVEGKTILLILAVGQLFNCLSGSVGVILQMTGNQKTYRFIMFYALVINLLLNLVLVNLYGVIGVAIATSLSMIIWNFWGVTIIKKKLKIFSFFTPEKFRL